MNSSLAAFTASITNALNTLGTGTIIMQEQNAAGTTTCLSTDGTGKNVTNNASTCSGINAYGGAVGLVPGQATTTTVTIKNVGTAPATGFALAPGSCNPTGGITGSATDSCSRLGIVITETVGGTTTIITPAGSTLTSIAAGNPLTLTAPVPGRNHRQLRVRGDVGRGGGTFIRVWLHLNHSYGPSLPDRPERLRLPVRSGLLAPASFVLICLIVLTSALVWRIQGGRWAVIETPSTGRAIPVGSLVLTRSPAITSLRVDDMITYRTRARPVELYTHRVITIKPDHTVQVLGDINGAADPYPVRSSDLVGIVVHHWRLLGWLIRAVPIVAVGVIVLLLASRRWIPPRWRSSVRVIGVCVGVAFTSLLLRPFVHPFLIAVRTDGQGSWGSVVSGGLLPTRVTGADRDFVDLVTGQTGVVGVRVTAVGGPVMINGSPHLTGWWLLGMIIICLSPLIWTTMVGLSPRDQGSRADP